MLRHLDLFSGIGGFALAARWLGGVTTGAFVECEPFCQRVLRKHWPTTPIHDDVREYSAPNRSFDLITAGFPCQDLSVAGKRIGLEGARSGLFYEVIRIAREVRPTFLILENVPGILSHADGETLQEVLFQVAKAGFNAEWAVVSAQDMGACHIRRRWWCVGYTQGLFSDAAHTNHTGSQGFWGGGQFQRSSSEVEVARRGGNGDATHQWGDWGTYLSQPCLRRGDDGLSNRVDRLKALGNAVVPECAMVPMARVLELSAMLDARRLPITH